MERIMIADNKLAVKDVVRKIRRERRRCVWTLSFYFAVRLFICYLIVSYQNESVWLWLFKAFLLCVVISDNFNTGQLIIDDIVSYDGVLLIPAIVSYEDGSKREAYVSPNTGIFIGQETLGDKYHEELIYLEVDGVESLIAFDLEYVKKKLTIY